jgi:hypothetical protein
VRRSLLSALVVLLPLASRGEDASPALSEAKALMREGLERELPSPTVRGPPDWPVPSARPPGQERKEKLEALGERVRNEASLRARTAAEERRAAPDNQPGVGQSRTRAAKSLGPPDKKPPRP